jgi:glyoxylase-like metal-dependent hydrolase (beta-lactamase superfamily II)
LSATWTVKLVHLPGHTPGHLAVYDPVNQALFAGDALMGNGIPDTQGRLVMPPHYFEVDWYLNSIKRAQGLDPQQLLATHYLPLVDRAVTQFLETSRAFVARLEATLLAMLWGAHQPVDMPALISAVRDQVGIPGADYQYGLLLRAHLRRLTEQGRALATGQAGLKRWTLAPG